MAEVVQFRRHLALCALLLLLDALARSGSCSRSLSASATPTRGARQTGAAAAGQQQQRLNDDSDDRPLVQVALEWFGSFMPRIDLNYTLNAGESFENHLLDQEVEEYYAERFPANMSLDELQLLSIKAATRLAPMPLHSSWGYESPEELLRSASPVQDDTRCQAHLGQLGERLRRQQMLGVAAGPQPQSARRAAFEATPVENLEAQLVYRSTDLQFARYLDTFGRVPSDLLRGNVKWYGSYPACMDTRLGADWRQGGTKRIRFRYCLAALKSSGWPTAPTAPDGTPVKPASSFGVHSTTLSGDAFFLKVGVCLPEACDSRALQTSPENAAIVERLLKFNLLKPFNSDHYYLSDLYCLPDERSELRSIPLLGKLLLAVSVCWLALIGLASAVHLNVERFYRKAVIEIRRQNAEGTCEDEDDEGGDSGDAGEQQRRLTCNSPTGGGGGASGKANNEFRESDVLGLKRRWLRLNVYLFDKAKRTVSGVDLIECLSLYSNWLKYTRRMKLAVAKLHADEQRRERRRARNAQLIEEARQRAAGRATDKQPPPQQLGAHQQAEQVNRQKRAPDELAAERELSRRDDLEELEADTVKRRVDTASLNALKVIALVWIIAGHCIFYLGSAISDGALLKNYTRDFAAFALANGAMYITELFFVITGCLTTYLAFRLNSVERQPAAANAAAAAAASGTGQDTSGSSGGSKKGAAAAAVATSNGSCSRVYLEPRMFKPTFWLGICIHRYLRILPTYLLVYAYVKLVSVYVGGKGPTWDYAVSGNSMRRKCVQESWLPVLTLTSNFVNIYDHCIVGGWYLSVDMQFMLMSVPIMIVLASCQRRRRSSSQRQNNSNNNNKQLQVNAGSQFVAFSKKTTDATFVNDEVGGQVHLTGPTTTTTPSTTTTTETANSQASEKQQEQIDAAAMAVGLVQVEPTNNRLMLGYALVAALGLLSALLAILFGIYQSQVDLSIMLRFLPHAVSVLSRSIAMYTNSVFRFRAFAFGLILGHLLYMYQFKLLQLPKFIQQHGAKLTTSIFAIGFSIMFAPVLYPANKIILSHDTTVILMVLAAGGIDVFLCALIFLICIGKAPKAVLFVLNSPGWELFSSLSLCAFVIHTEIIALLSSQLMPLPSASYWLLLYVFSATLLLTYSIALVLYLTFEMPFGRLVEAVLLKCMGGSNSSRSASSRLENPAAR